MWKPLGTLTPTEDWALFPLPTFATTFRITYSGDFQRINSSGYLRQFYAVNQVSQAVRLYPKPESVIFEMEIPREMRAYGQVQRFLQIKKLLNRRQSTDVWWTARIEELI
jgi:hypothetical protein